MKHARRIVPVAVLAFAAVLAADNAKIANLLSGASGFQDAKNLKPGMFRKITADALPKPYATRSNSNTNLAERPAGALPQVPAGFKVELLVDKLTIPRQIRI